MQQRVKTMKAYRKIVLLFIIVSIAASGCAVSEQVPTGSADENKTESIHEDEKAPYLSITETVYTDTSQTEMVSMCSIYDFEKKKLIYKGQVPYTSGYPLTTYSSTQKSIFYSALSDRGDQLYRQYRKENEQMTDDLCALNYIIQCDDKIFLAAKYLDHYCMEPIFFDLKNKEVRQIFPDENDDRFTWTATCDPKAEKIYFSCYSDNLQRGDLEEYNRQNHTEETEVPECAPSTIYCVDIQTEKVTPAAQTDYYIWGMAVSGEQLYYCGSNSSLSPKEEHTCFFVDLETKEQSELDIPVLISGDMAVWDNTLYCIGWKDTVRGIYAIDLSTKDTILLYSASENGFVNGFSLNY